MYIITLCILRGRARCCTVWTIIFAVLNFCKCLPICELGLEEIVLKKSRPPWWKRWQDFHSPSGWYQTAGCLTCFSQLRSPHFNLRKLWRFSPGKMKLYDTYIWLAPCSHIPVRIECLLASLLFVTCVGYQRASHQLMVSCLLVPSGPWPTIFPEFRWVDSTECVKWIHNWQWNHWF